MLNRFIPLLIAFCTVGAVPACAEVATISVDCSQPGPRVNPHMYGIFFEELNHSGEGGLYAELIRNRSFEDGNLPEGMQLIDGFAMTAPNRKKIAWPPTKDEIPGWTPIKHTGADFDIALDTEKPLNQAQKHSLKISIRRGTAGIANTGFWGIALKARETYNLSLYARSGAGFKGRMLAALEDEKGKPLSKPAPITGIGPEWKKLTGKLVADTTYNNARLALYVDSPGSVWLDVVSLFPRHTYGERPNGLRADLVEMLKDLRPGFMRFPGGCITEGLTLEQGYHWKDTIGDIAQRPGVWNSMWGYRRTDGLGFHELLQLCEDTSAAPMFCLNVGVACTIHSPGISAPMSDMKKYVDDAVDAISYANDPPTQNWGKLRAKNGHPKPFVIKYVNIGNELRGEAYSERYPLFYARIKARYPDVLTIAYAGIGSNTKTPIEILDIHDYRDDAWFLSRMNQWDSYDRTKRISCTELAVRNHTNHTLHNALLEAAYLIGMERNADVVRAVSYAPLFLNTNHPSPWEPDLIHFNNHQVFGTPSYYVQKLFMTNRPDVVLKTEVQAAPQTVYALAGKDEKNNEIVVKAVNLAGTEQPVTIDLKGITRLGAKAVATVLTSGDEMDRNSFAEPTKVSPVTRTISVAGPSFTYTLQKHSMTVIRVALK